MLKMQFGIQRLLQVFRQDMELTLLRSVLSISTWLL